MHNIVRKFKRDHCTSLHLAPLAAFRHVNATPRMTANDGARCEIGMPSTLSPAAPSQHVHKCAGAVAAGDNDVSVGAGDAYKEDLNLEGVLTPRL